MGSCKELESMLQVPSQRVNKSPFYTAEIFGAARVKKVGVPKADIRLISLIQLLHANLLLRLFNFFLSPLLPAKQFKLFSLFLIRC